MMKTKKIQPIWAHLLNDRRSVKLILLLVVFFGLIMLAVGFFNLGIRADEQYYQQNY
ncbi:hypothetical protein HY065_00165 [Candidatus Berkelbacteria bacterium]|nr:hypothetical protein [Candidatus Berkelbacteria bacterium]